jgi:hypothetical protein
VYFRKKKAAASLVYDATVVRLLCAVLSLVAACVKHDPRTHLRSELVFLQTGVRLEDEEQEVRRVLAQRALRVVSRLEGPGFVAVGAASRDGVHSAVRIISSRGVQIAEDAASDDLFVPSHVSLLEHFGGAHGDDYVFVATARIPHARDAGCVNLYRVMRDGSVLAAVLDVGELGVGACVSNIAPGGARLRVRIAFPALYALKTPQIDAELAIVEPLIGQAPAAVPVAKIVVDASWLEAERERLSVMRLSRAPFSERHGAGIARAAIARLAGQSTDAQIAAYRNAVHRVLPGSTEADTVSEAVAYMARGWSELEPPPPLEAGEEAVEAPAELPPTSETEAQDAVVIEPDTFDDPR